MSPIERVQIVDDDPRSVAFFTKVVAATFPHVAISTQHTLADARDALQGPPPDLVLLDLHLPDGLGVELVGDIRARSADSMIVVITIFDDDQNLFGAIQRGIDGYLLKAETERGAAQKLLGILRGEPPLSARVARRMLRHLGAPPSAPEPDLTPRERDVVSLLAGGASIAEAARALSISPHTVHHHVRNLYRKLGVHSRAAMTQAALRRGLL